MSDRRQEERGIGRVRISLLIGAAPNLFMTQIDSLWPVRQISFTLIPRNECNMADVLETVNHPTT